MSMTLESNTRPTEDAIRRETTPDDEPIGGAEGAFDDTLYSVVLHNDDRHSLRYCSRLLREVFACSEATACVLTWQVHTEGRTVVWSGHRDAVERKCEEAQRFQQLNPDSERVLLQDGPDEGQPPLRTTIERVARDASADGHAGRDGRH